ncbi:MAG: PhzF family phenazine biosynthesis protein, partial [Kordiimonadaceae bacterium]|nr:PhzF family phenazine biosynthesis protein [Kordiimonadaceae bacterium]
MAETAYLVRADGEVADYHLRWFTPTTEVALCGHATLASAYVVLKHLQPNMPCIRFSTLSGILTVIKQDDKLVMSFPALPVNQIDTPAGLGIAMGAEPKAVYKGEEADRDLLL